MTPAARVEGGLISGFVIRVIIFFAILVLGVNELGQVIVAQVKASGAASKAAEAAARSFKSTQNFELASAAADTAAKGEDPTIAVAKVDIAPDGAATVTVAKTANTMVIRRVSFLRKFGIQHATEESAAPE
jgi:Flp pilus assembly protein TadG